jgi:hypothetical protein
MDYEYEKWFKNQIKSKDIRQLIAVKVFTERILHDMNLIRDVDVLTKSREMIVILQQQWVIVKRELSCR